MSAAKDPEAESVYEMYYDYNEPLAKAAGHRTLAINRGEKEKVLTVRIEAPVDRCYPLSGKTGDYQYSGADRTNSS